MKKDIIKQFNLPKYIKGKTFAEGSKAINNKFKDREDPQAKKTKEELLGRLAEAQEYVKMQEQLSQDSMRSSMDNNAQEVPDQMQGQIPEGMEEFMEQPQPQEQPQGQPQMQGQPQPQMQPGQNQMFAGGALGALMQAGGPAAAAGAGGGTQAIAGGLQSQGIQQGAAQMPDASNMIQMPNQSPNMGQNLGQAMNPPNQDMNLPSQAKPKPKKDGIMDLAEGSGVPGAEVFGMANKAFGDTGVDTTGNAAYMEEKNVGGETAKGALSGAAAGAQVAGPWGAVAGGVLGGASSLFGSKKANKDITEGNMKKDLSVNSKLAGNSFSKGGKMNSYKYGGKMNSYEDGGPMSTFQLGIQEAMKQKEAMNNIGNPQNSLMDNRGLSQNPTAESVGSPTSQGIDLEGITTKMNIPNKKTNEGFGKKALGFVNDNLADAGRMSGTAFNLLRANNLDPAERVKRQTLDNVYNPNYADTNRMTNQIDQSNVNKALAESSGGDMGALRSSILAANLNKDKAKSKGFQAANDVNRGEDTKVQNSEISNDKFNVSQSNLDLTDNQMAIGTRETAKNNLTTAGINNIGQIAKEMQDRKTAKEATGYTFDGEYVTSKDGNETKLSDIGVSKKDNKFFNAEGKELTKKEVIELSKNK